MLAYLHQNSSFFNDDESGLASGQPVFAGNENGPHFVSLRDFGFVTSVEVFFAKTFGNSLSDINIIFRA